MLKLPHHTKMFVVLPITLIGNAFLKISHFLKCFSLIFPEKILFLKYRYILQLTMAGHIYSLKALADVFDNSN